ncbi:MAG: PCYCGC motif-containing (lipo)protein, partial [Gemmatimonadales bacterium]
MNKRMIPWGVTGAALVGVVSLLAIGGTGSRHAHPDPRMDEPDLALTVMPASLAGSSSRVIRAYRIAQQIPHTLDALHCHCECKENFGHRSLLTCF